MQSLHIGILLWSPRRTNGGVNAQAKQEATECGGKLPQALTPNPSAIAIKGHASRTPIAGEEAGHGFQGCFRMKIWAGFGHEPGGGPRIDPR
jgi:hypothetical protein